MSRPDWELETRSGLAVAALRLIAPRFKGLRFDVEVSADAERRRPFLRGYRGADELDLIVDDEQRAVVVTRDPEVVGFLSGRAFADAAAPFVTVAVRADELAAAMYFDCDGDRYYIAEQSDVVLQASIEAARHAGFDVVVADEGVWVMSGTSDYVASLKAWSRRPGGFSPFTPQS